jgi:gamma-glutamylcyclotransferase (GGCT)/AIG2-like uncharacterized protein YtfP
MPSLFSYGTLQDDRVQQSTFGRRLHGRKDELRGFEPSLAPIEEHLQAAAGGRTHHANVTFTGRADTGVSGTVFEVTDAELAAADEYERGASYVRIAVRLASGTPAWVYVEARSARGETSIAPAGEPGQSE